MWDDEDYKINGPSLMRNRERFRVEESKCLKQCNVQGPNGKARNLMDQVSR